MEYERIHKVQTGIISPSKLRLKLIGSQRKKDESNCNSSRTSPSKLVDSEFVNSSLLSDRDGNLAHEGLSLEVEPVKSDITTGSSQPSDLMPRNSNNGDPVKTRALPGSKPDSMSSSSVHLSRSNEDDNLDYDSTSSFEFHKGDHKLPLQQHSASRLLTRHVPSKWNDAEKWIVSRQNVVQPNVLKRANSQNQTSRPLGGSIGRVVPEQGPPENRASIKRVDFVQPTSQMGLSKFGCGPGSGQSVDLCPESRDLREVDDKGLPSATSVTDETTVGPAIRSVSMRDMGTEMTPIPSQEPSRSATPMSSTTPLRSPTSSVPSTPRRGAPAPTPTEHDIFNQTPHHLTAEKKELSEEEMKLRTRREIVALGVQLGKMNIAAWASKDEKGILGNENAGGDEAERVEYAKRAAAWEEAEKSKHAARCKREEIRIQAWESQRQAQLEAEMRKIEAQIEQLRAQAQAKLVKKIALARQKSEEKRASAEARKNRQAEKMAARAEYIRQTGWIPSSSPFHCCGWL